MREAHFLRIFNSTPAYLTRRSSPIFTKLFAFWIADLQCLVTKNNESSGDLNFLAELNLRQRLLPSPTHNQHFTLWKELLMQHVRKRFHSLWVRILPINASVISFLNCNHSVPSSVDVIGHLKTLDAVITSCCNRWCNYPNSRTGREFHFSLRPTTRCCRNSFSTRPFTI